MKISVIAVAVAVAGFGGAADAKEFVVNGDFTSLTNGLGQLGNNTEATGWTSDGYNFVFHVADEAVPQGGGTLALWDAANKHGGDVNTWDGKTLSGLGNFVALDGDYQTGPLEQTVTGLVVGQSYTFSFNYAFGQQEGFNGQTWQDLIASIGSTSVTVPSAYSDCTGGGDNQMCTGGQEVVNHGFSGWSTYSTTIVASAATETLSFLAEGSKPVPPFALFSDVSLVGPAAPEASTWAMMLAGFAGLSFLGYRSRRKAAAAA